MEQPPDRNCGRHQLTLDDDRPRCSRRGTPLRLTPARHPQIQQTRRPPGNRAAVDSLRLNLNAKPPAVCAAPLYGTIAARAPDGALCLCHQSYDGKQSIWEQIGTGRSCWPDQK